MWGTEFFRVCVDRIRMVVSRNASYQGWLGAMLLSCDARSTRRRRYVAAPREHWPRLVAWLAPLGGLLREGGQGLGGEESVLLGHLGLGLFKFQRLMSF